MKKLLTIGLMFLFLTTVVGMTACSKKQVAAEPNSAEAVNPAGEYVLVSVDGKEVPATVSHSGTELQVISGAFTINADGTCSSTSVFVPPGGSEIERTVAATYVLDGNQMTMKWEGAGMTVGAVEGETFTMNNESMLFVYRRTTP